MCILPDIDIMYRFYLKCCFKVFLPCLTPKLQSNMESARPLDFAMHLFPLHYHNCSYYWTAYCSTNLVNDC